MIIFQVVTLTKHRGFGKPDDEQLHVLPLYVLETTDENDSYDGQCEKIANGSLEVLHRYALEARTRSEPLMTCKKRAALAKKEKSKLSPGRKRAVSPQGGRISPLGSSSSTTSTPKKPKVKRDPAMYSQDSNQSLYDGSQSSQPGSLAGTPVKQDTQKQNKGSKQHKTGTGDNRQLTYDELMAYSTQAGFTGLYESFWDYFYTNGVFPPSSFLSSHTKPGQQTNVQNDTQSAKQMNNVKGSETHSMISEQNKNPSSSISNKDPPVTSVADQGVPQTTTKSGDRSAQQQTQNISGSHQQHQYNSGFQQSSSQPMNHPFQQSPSQSSSQWPQQSSNQTLNHQFQQSSSQSWDKMAANHKTIQSSEQKLEYNDKPLDLHKNGYVKHNETYNKESEKVNLYNANFEKISFEQMNASGNMLFKGSVQSDKGTPVNLKANQTTESKMPLHGQSNGYTKPLTNNGKPETKSAVDLYSFADHSDDDNDVLDLSSSGNFKEFKSTLDQLEHELGGGSVQNEVKVTRGASEMNITDESGEINKENSQVNISEQVTMRKSGNENKNNVTVTSSQSLANMRDQSAIVKNRTSSLFNHSFPQYSAQPYAPFSSYKDSQLQHHSTATDPQKVAASQMSTNTNELMHTNSASREQSSIASAVNSNTVQTSSNSTPHAHAGNAARTPAQHINCSGSSEKQGTLSETKPQVSSSKSDVTITNPFDSPTRDNGWQNYYQMYYSGLYPKEWFNFSSQANIQNSAKVPSSNSAVKGNNQMNTKPGKAHENKNNPDSNDCKANRSDMNVEATGSTKTATVENANSYSSQSTASKNVFGYQSNYEQNSSNLKGSGPSDISQDQGHTFSNSKTELKSCNANTEMSETRDRSDFSSPLHLLSEAVEIRSKDMEQTNESVKHWNNSNQNQNNQNMTNTQYQPGYQSKNQNNSMNQSKFPPVGRAEDQPNVPPNGRAFPMAGHNYNPNQTMPFNFSKQAAMGQMQVEEDPNIDKTVVKCEMEYNENAFHDPYIGGVAIALSHGAVLFEVAKRELHATTGLRRPDRYHPTRISLVFYQHKNLNYEDHGWHVYAKKMEDMKQQRIAKMQAERGLVDMEEIENSFKGGKKRKLKPEKGEKCEEEEEEKIDFSKTSAAQYRYMWDCNVKHGLAQTTNTVTAKWINPEPMVSGPYQKWV